MCSVLLLDLYEKFVINRPRKKASWMSHVNGALALVKVRDPDQFQNYTGIRLASRLVVHLILSCVAANAPVPPELILFRSDLEPHLNSNDPKWQISGLVIKYANLQAAIPRLSTYDAVLRATRLDEEFEALAKRMPPKWLYSTEHLESDRVYESRFEMYRDHATTQGWNSLRNIRILLNDLLATLVEAPRTEYIRDTIDSLAKDICASVPQFTTRERSVIQQSQCYGLTLPLYVAGIFSSPKTNIRPWVLKELDFISSEVGIQKAAVVANIMRKGDGTCPWIIYAVLGSYAFAA